MKKVGEMKIKDVKILLDIDGQEVEAIRVTDSDLEQLDSSLRDGGCDCGKQICVNGYVWVCRFDRPNCYWFKTRVRCND